MIKLLLIDDSAFIRAVVKKMVAADPEIQVVGEAASGAEGLERIMEFGPDVVMLDIVMPREDGLSTLKKIITTYPTPVILFSSLSASMSEVTRSAFDMGAFDVVQKPPSPDKFSLIADELIRKIKAASKVNRSKLGIMYSTLLRVSEGEKQALLSPHIIAIGCSINKPALLEAMLNLLPKNLPAGIIIHQYMPQELVQPWIEHMQSTTALRMKLAEDGDLVAPGRILLSPREKIIEVNRLEHGGVVALMDFEKREKPCIDTMLESVAQAYGPRAIAVILSGMGVDGIDGLRAIKEKGGKTFVQQDMLIPEEVMTEKLADYFFPAERIAEEITRVLIG